jgi:hypothetical protein
MIPSQAAYLAGKGLVSKSISERKAQFDRGMSETKETLLGQSAERKSTSLGHWRVSVMPSHEGRCINNAL